MHYTHQLEFKVRDYECDMQGVVNNAIYQNYLEHARHEFLHAQGINFAQTTAAGINLVVIRAELDYRKSLVSNDEFVVCSALRRLSRLRFQFIQDIYRLADRELILNALITGTATDSRGRPCLPDALQVMFTDSDPD
jgi:acyl-CoA thioester hydrolase